MSKTLDKIELYKKSELQTLLSQCTEPQQKMFARMYGDIATMPNEKVDWAIQQCERTITKNKTKETL